MYDFYSDFERLGIRKGDTVLMHSSMKALGTSETPETFLDALCTYLGEKGTLLLPTLSYDIVHSGENVFSLTETSACIGLLPNVFLQMEGIVRSMHPTHSCAAKGYLAKELTCRHAEDITPVGPNSPFRLLPGVGGKILMVGDVNDHNTFMHGMEEIAKVPYCLSKETRLYTLIDANGVKTQKEMYPHWFKTVARQCYSRAEALLPESGISRGKICAADCTLMDTAALQAVTVPKMREQPYYFVDLK